MPELPDDLAVFAEACREAFGLQQWRITYKYKKLLKNNPHAEGLCSFSARYFKATIKLRQTHDMHSARETLIHEHLHLCLAPLQLAFDHIKNLIPEDQHHLVQEMFESALEQTIEPLSRALYATLTVESRD